MKKMFTLLLSLCLMLSLAACGEPTEDTQPKDTKPGTTKPNNEVRFLWDEEGY